MLTINLLQALPKAPLWDRLERAGRLVIDDSRESNVDFLRPYDEVMAMWRRSIAYANDPERLFTRFQHQVEATFANRVVPPAAGKLTWSNLSGAVVMTFRIVFYLGILADYRRPFWRAIHYALRRGKIEAVFGISFVAYHLIEFTREALRGEQNASFYSQARKERRSRRFPWRKEEESLFT
jgi:hypothetical protein